VVDVEAKASTAPKMGPTQGVQPNANAEPMASELNGLPISRKDGIFNRFSTCRKGNLNTPNIKSPNIITKTPAIRVSQILKGTSACPSNPISVPNMIKTTENPITKKRPFRKTFFLANFAFFGSRKSSAETPLMNPIYAGTSGSVQGAKKVNMPAINTDIINTMLIGSIMYYSLTMSLVLLLISLISMGPRLWKRMFPSLSTKSVSGIENPPID